MRSNRFTRFLFSIIHSCRHERSWSANRAKLRHKDTYAVQLALYFVHDSNSKEIPHAGSYPNRCKWPSYSAIFKRRHKKKPSHRFGSSILLVLLLWILIHGHAGVAHAQWRNQFNLMGTDDLIKAIAKDQLGNIYIAGSFRNIGKTSANQIAKWDGSSWAAVGGGVNNSVAALAIDGNGLIYAGGNLNRAGGISVSGVAKWDGASWSALGTGVNGAVVSLACDTENNLYAGGAFTIAGAVTANRIAMWDGASWSALGTGMNDSVRTILLDNSDNLYAGGSFTTAGGMTSINVAKWDGSSWHAIGFSNATFSHVNGLAFDPIGNLYACGFFSEERGAPGNNVAKWDGSAWHRLGDGINDITASIQFDDNGTLYLTFRTIFYRFCLIF